VQLLPTAVAREELDLRLRSLRMPPEAIVVVEMLSPCTAHWRASSKPSIERARAIKGVELPCKMWYNFRNSQQSVAEAPSGTPCQALMA
jgi:hypothetical protein